MKKLMIIIIALALSFSSKAQTQNRIVKIDTTAESDKHWNEWLSNLYEMGIVKEKDSVKINPESMQVINDSNLRKVMYPKIYTWKAASFFLKQLELKKGFWYLINLYAADTANKKMVVESLVQFDQIMDMEKVLVSTFYTYALLDPAMSEIKNGKPQVTRPDLLEKKFSQLKEIVAYVGYYRNERKTKEMKENIKPTGR